MPVPEVTGMTERSFFCMLPEDLGGCEETENLIPIHHKQTDEHSGEVTEGKILGWLCKGHAMTLAMKNVHRGPS